jgi:hypothetical protein
MTNQALCARCYIPIEGTPEEVNCFEKPERLAGSPIGMYHCPDCGAMVLAGVPHPPLCDLCLARKHPSFDRP